MPGSIAARKPFAQRPVGLASSLAVWTLAAAWFVTAPGCIWLDDFGKFKIGDAGTAPDSHDAQAGQPKADAASDDAATRCSAVDCSDLDDGCQRGICDPGTGTCTTEQAADGTSCFDGNPCTYGDTCTAGECRGQALDCSALDDECSQGMCDPETGGCTFGPNQMSKPCDDADACTINDRCTDDPQNRCVGETAPAGTDCTDFNSCTGTDTEPDQCDDNAHCVPGAPIATGTTCDDLNECTESDKCSDTGVCVGAPIREGEPCETSCTSNTTCQQGKCLPSEGEAPAYDSQCLFSFCGLSSICQDKWQTDLVCHCGCGYEDPACSPCSPYMCQTHANHQAARWCDNTGTPADNCSDSLMGDGKCDCGCQFDDPDCNGGDCCAGTGEAGCNDSYVEECVCDRRPNGDPDCCDTEWTDRCAQLAVNLGCMLCP